MCRTWRIGLFGGSFNPIHLAHISLARQLHEAAGLDEVWLMVSPQNPLKQNSDLLDDGLRYQMARIALHGEQGIKASPYEMCLPRPSYTWNTLQHLRHDYPDVTFVLLVGGDNWSHFHRWYKADDIIANYDIVIYPRPGDDFDAAALPPTVTVVSAKLFDISSTDIRQRLRQGGSVGGMLPTAIIPLARRFYSLPQTR